MAAMFLMTVVGNPLETMDADVAYCKLEIVIRACFSALHRRLRMKTLSKCWGRRVLTFRRIRKREQFCQFGKCFT